MQQSPQEGPEYSEPFIGTIGEKGVHTDTPAAVEDFISEHGIADRTYTCKVYKTVLEGGGQRELLPIQQKNKFPEPDELGRTYGSGQYHYQFSWKEKDPVNGKNVPRIKDYKIYLSEHYDEIAEINAIERMMKMDKKADAAASKMRFKNILKGKDGNAEPQKDPIDELRKANMVLKEFSVGSNNGGNMSEMLMFMTQMQQKSTDNMMQMMMQMQQASMQLVGTIIGAQQQIQTPQQPDSMAHFKEMFNMVQGMQEMKSILSPEKETIVDRVFKMAESAMPMIAQIAQMPKQERDSNPMVNAVRANPDVNEILNDPAMTDAIKEKLIASHGEEDTNIILETLGAKKEDEGVPSMKPIDVGDLPE